MLKTLCIIVILLINKTKTMKINNCKTCGHKIKEELKKFCSEGCYHIYKEDNKKQFNKIKSDSSKWINYTK